MEVACGEHGDWTYKLKKAVECMDDLDDDSSLGDESTYEGKQEMALQASTLCLLQEKVDKRPSVIKVRIGSSNLSGEINLVMKTISSLKSYFKVLIGK